MAAPHAVAAPGRRAGAEPATLPRRVVASVLLAGALVGLLTPPRFVADASIYLCMALSLVHDRDLRWTPADLARVRELDVEPVPEGLFLIQRETDYIFAKPALYPLLAAPLVAAIGPRGFTLLNGVLLAALVLLGADTLAHRLRGQAALGVAALLVLASVTPAYLHWIDPFLLSSVLVAAAIAAWRRGHAAATGVLIGLLSAVRPPYAVLAFAPLWLALSAGRRDQAARLCLAGVLTALAGLALVRVGAGEWSPYLGERLYFPIRVPFEVPDASAIGIRYSRVELLGGWQPPPLAQIVRGAGELVVGRFAGLLLYVPGLFAAAFWMRRFDREKIAWLLAVALFCLITLLIVPHRRIGGTHALGNRWFVMLPVAFVLVDFVGWHRLRLLASAALLAFAVPVVQNPVGLTLHPGWQTLEAPYRWFPVEWVAAPDLPYPYELPGMMALTRNQFGVEEGGVWTRGGRRAEFVLFRPPGPPPVVEVWSLLSRARLGQPGALVEHQFQPFVRQRIELTQPEVVIHDEYRDYAEVGVYRFVVETDAAVRPVEAGYGDDRRPLGVFVRALP